MNGDFFTVGGAMHQLAQIPAGFLHGQCFHAKILQASGSNANGGVDFDQLLVVGQLAERRGDADFFGHELNFNFWTSINQTRKHDSTQHLLFDRAYRAKPP